MKPTPSAAKRPGRARGPDGAFRLTADVQLTFLRYEMIANT